jgi:hypothetical protein
MWSKLNQKERSLPSGRALQWMFNLSSKHPGGRAVQCDFGDRWPPFHDRSYRDESMNDRALMGSGAAPLPINDKYCRRAYYVARWLALCELKTNKRRAPRLSEAFSRSLCGSGYSHFYAQRYLLMTTIFNNRLLAVERCLVPGFSTK